MYQCCTFKDELYLLVKSFAKTNKACVCMYLSSMLYAHRVSIVIADHGKRK